MVVVPNNSILNQVQLLEDGKFEKWAGRARCSGVSKFFFSIFDEEELLDLFSQISQGHGESLEGPEEFFLYIEDGWDLGTPYTWQFYRGLRL